ncbi:hypothetical protein [Actinomyces qiguomingii]|uniref:hypothetical protein n=1 Tax=Actinomyces qiguomingii TaxID=2057800 RepID=UPI000FFE6F3D|nr:hypothetical protein [Actinomyces qiguomingii]
MSQPAYARRQPPRRAAVWVVAVALFMGIVGTIGATGVVETAVPDAAAASSTSSSPEPGAATGAASAADGRSAPLVVLGVDGLSWQKLRELSGDADARVSAAAASVLNYAEKNTPVNLVQRTIGEDTCPADGWLTLGTGTRARAFHRNTRDTAACADSTWEEAARLATADGYGAQPGALAQALEAGGASYAAVGNGAVLALTTQDGPPATLDPTTVSTTADGQLPDLTLIDLMDVGLITGSSSSAAAERAAGATGATAGEAPAARAVIALASALETLAGRVRVVVVSVADPRDPSPQLAILPADTGSARGNVNGLLVGPTTHRPGLIQLTDLAPTLLAAVVGDGAVAASGLGGGVLTLPSAPPIPPTDSASAPDSSSAAHTDRVSELADDAVHAVASNRAVIPVTLVLLAAALALLIAVGAALRHPSCGERAWLGAAARWVTALPAGLWLANLVPWWRAGAWAPAVAVLAAAAWGLALAVGAGAVARVDRLGRSGAALALAATGPVVILADAAAGSPLGFNGPLGMNAVVAGRFYGVSNTAFALAAGALVAVLAAGAQRLAAGHSRRLPVVAAAVGLPGLVVLVVDGAPFLGADVGGALTLIPVLVSLAAGLAGVRLGPRRWLGVAAVSVGVVVAFALADYATGSRTHLGGFVRQTLDGSAGSTLMRKADALIAPFRTSPLALLALVLGVGFAIGVVWWLWRTVRVARSGRGPYAWLAATPAPAWLEPALRALVVLMAVEMVVNDSGATMLLFSLAAALPALVTLLECGPGVDQRLCHIIAPDGEKAEGPEALRQSAVKC